MTLILEERAFASCPKLKRFGTTDTSRPDALIMVLPSGADIQKDAFLLPDVRKMVISSPANITVAGSAGFNELEVLNAPNTKIDYATVAGAVNQKVTSTGNIVINSDSSTADISLEAKAGILVGSNGTITCDTLTNFVSLALGSIPQFPSILYASASKLQSLSVPISYSGDITDIMKAPNLKKLTILYSVYPLNLSIFQGNTKLDELIISSAIDTIPEFAFAGCTNLKKLQIGSVEGALDVVNIERGAFYKCAKLETIKFTERLKKIGDVAFMDSGISGEVVIPKNVTNHGAFYFFRCNNLTKLKYLCNLLDFTDPTTININKMQGLTEIVSNNITFEIDGDITVTPGEDVPTHTYTYNGSTTTVNETFFASSYNSATYKSRNQKYKDIIAFLYSMQDQVTTIESILESSAYTPFKTADATKAKATKIADNLGLMRENIQDFTSYIQENAVTTATRFYEAIVPKMQDEVSGLLDGLITEIKTLLTEANIPAISDPIVAIISAGIIAPRNLIVAKLEEIKTLNDTIRQNGDVTVNAPVYIKKNPSIASRVNVTAPTNIITDYTGASTIITENGSTYMRYASTDLDNVTTLAGFELNDGTTYVVDGWFRYRMDDHYSKHHIDVITNLLSIIQNGSYDNKDIDYELVAPKIISVTNLKDYKGVSLSITAPAVIIGEGAMEELSDVTLTINASTLRIEDCAFATSQNIKLNITSVSDIICGKNILLDSSLITINTNKELLNIPAEPIILNNISVNYWDKNIKELLDIIKNETAIDTTSAYDVEYTTFTAVGSVNPIFAISFRTSADLKEHTVIIPPSDYYWTLSIGEVIRDARDFSYSGKNMVYYPDKAMRDSRSAEWKHNNNALLSSINTDNYGLTNNFAPNSFTFKGYTFVQKEKIANRTMLQVCTNNGEALSERRKNNILDTFFKVLDIIGIVTMVIPFGAIAKSVTLPIKLFFTSTRIGLSIASRVSRIGRLIVKAASVVTNRIKNSRVFLKAGKNSEMLETFSQVASCAIRNAGVCSLRNLTRKTLSTVNTGGSYRRISFVANPLKKNADEVVAAAITYGDDAPTFATLRELPRSGSIRNVGQRAVTVKPVKFSGKGTVENITLGKPTKLTATVTRGKQASSAVTKVKVAKTLPKQKYTTKLNLTAKGAKKDLFTSTVEQLEITAKTDEAFQKSMLQAARETEKYSAANAIVTSQNEEIAKQYKIWWTKGGMGLEPMLATKNVRKLLDPLAKQNARATLIARAKMAGIATAVGSVIIGTAVGVTKKKNSNRSIQDIKPYIDTITSRFAAFNTALTNNVSTEEQFTAQKNALIATLVEEFRTNTDLNITEATNLVTEIVDYITASNEEKDNYMYAESIMSILTDIINTNEAISSEEAVEFLHTFSQLLTDNSLLDTDIKNIEALASAPDSVYGSTTTDSGTVIPGFNNYSLKHIAMYTLLNNLHYLGVHPDESNTPSVSASDPAALEIPSRLSSLMSDTISYTSPPYVNPMPYRNSNIRTIADTYKDNIEYVRVTFNNNTTVSYLINATWKDKFDVIIENPTRVEIVRRVLVDVTLNNVKYLRIISSTVEHWTPNNVYVNLPVVGNILLGDIRLYNGVDEVQYCIEPSTWLALETYIGMGTTRQDDLYTERDDQGQINAPYTTANPLLLNDNFMWNYTKLRTLDVADNGDFAALQVPFVNSSDGLSASVPPMPIPHKSGLYMGWNSVKYELSNAEDTIMNMALGSASDLIINYVNSTQTTIPAHAYSSCGVTPVSDAGPFSVVGVTLPSTITSIGKKAFYRSGIDFAVIPSNVRSIATQAFAEAGISTVKFIDNPSIKIIPGGEAYIGAGGSTYKITYKDISQIPNYRSSNIIFNKADVIIENPGSFVIRNIPYDNISFVIMLRATINVLETPNSGYESSIFNSLWVNDGRIIAETYILGLKNTTITDYASGKAILSTNASTQIEVIVRRGTGNYIGPGQYINKADIIMRSPVSLTINGEVLTSISKIYIYDVDLVTKETRVPKVNEYGVIYEVIEYSYRLADVNQATGIGEITAEAYTVLQNVRDRAAPRAIEDSIDIGPNAFADNTELQTLVLPPTIRNIGDNAFAGCTSLTTVELPPLKSIGDSVFADCTALTSVSIPPNVESLGAGVFDNCPALTTLTFNGVPPATIDPGFFTSIASLSNPVTITVPPQYAPALITAIKSAGINLGSSSTNLTIAINNSNATPYFPLLIGPTVSRVKETLYVYSSAAMESLKAGLAINPATKYVSWLAGGAAYDGMLVRPLGRKVHVFTAEPRPDIKYVFMNVQLISTATVPRLTDREPYLTGWVCTWSADGIYPVL